LSGAAGAPAAGLAHNATGADLEQAPERRERALTRISYSYLDSPVGRLLLAGDAEGLVLIGFPSEARPTAPGSGWTRDDGALAEPIAQLRSYFAGERREFSLPLCTQGTPFQERVWAALRAIPFGATVSYGDLARRIGRPSAARAVGAANGANPLPIVIPCHRVIGADRSLTGFGGGLATKRFLLAHEARFSPDAPHQAELFY
jgi:methylated-DNA-[protein]-cysteine S-methyltransferase